MNVETKHCMRDLRVSNPWRFLSLFDSILIANPYSITILLETYLSRSTLYQEPPGLTPSPDINSYNLTKTKAFFNSIQFNAKSTSKDLCSYNSTRTQASLKAIFDSMLNQLANISTRIIQRDHKLSFKLYSIRNKSKVSVN